jgi:hypothetical protein
VLFDIAMHRQDTNGKDRGTISLIAELEAGIALQILSQQASGCVELRRGRLLGGREPVKAATANSTVIAGVLAVRATSFAVF